MITRHSIVGGTMCALAALMPASVSAQTDPAVSDATSASTQAGTEGVEDGQTAEIIVTAQRRAENLQNVPIAITALSADKLAASSITSTQDLQLVTPGLQFVSGAGAAQPRLRGIGSAGIGPGVENAIATYVDNVYIGAQTGLVLPLNNIAQVAVLKGPQGTLFGRNATGGVIQITTLDPQDTFSGKADLTYGNHNTYGGNLYLTGGLADGVAADFSAYYNDLHDGFGTNIVTGNRVGREETLALRSKLRLDFDSATQLVLSGDYARLRSDTPSYRPRYNSVSAGGYVFTAGKFDISADVDPRISSDSYGVSGQLTRELGRMDLVSITAYRDVDFHLLFDNDRTPAKLLTSAVTEKDHQFSQELQLVSKGAGKLKWVVGVYYFQSGGRYVPYTTFSTSQPKDTRQQVILSHQTAESKAVFGQADYRLGDNTTLTAGLRYTDEKRKFDAISYDELLTGATRQTASTAGEIDFGKPTWRLSLDHRFSPEVLAYVSYSRGSKSGVFNSTGLPAQPVKPETLDDYEVGLKTDLLDRRLRLNAALFYYDYTNIQLNRFDGGAQVIYNADGARIYGLDADFDASLFSRLSIQGGLNITRSKFRSFPSAITALPKAGGGFTVVPIDATGNQIQKTPRWTASTTIKYSLPLPDGSLDLSADYYHSDGWFAEPDNRLRQPPYDTLGASALWKFGGDKYSLRLWGKNLTNEVYAVTITSSSRVEAYWPAQGRTFGITAGVNF